MLAMFFCLGWIVSCRLCNVRPDVVDDDRDAQAMFTAEDVLEKCCFPSALELISYRSYQSYLQSSVYALTRKPDRSVTGKV